jgi:hypothetical protein
MTDILEQQRARLSAAVERSKLPAKESAERRRSSRAHLKNKMLREGVKRLLTQSPRPSYAAVAAELKCSRQRAHQLAVDLGLVEHQKKGKVSA